MYAVIYFHFYQEASDGSYRIFADNVRDSNTPQ